MVKVKENVVVLSLEEYDRLKEIENTYGKSHSVFVKSGSPFSPYIEIHSDDDVTIKVAKELKAMTGECVKLEKELNKLKNEH